ncbi:hypothetical protein Patl1_21724 [Pistacia atlantica]|uniref:Uncharacterized protein n=1 Tax=Pistacia atlantica TaxID=434234 RepID=A0ACC1BLM5_9ROSI|nr:hypothetical protein Patl1_21724 [Pistacia atlantica]
MRHAILLLESNFPFVKVVGAHKVARFVTYDEIRMNIVEIGGAQELVYMLGDAEDYDTRIGALKALVALSGSVERQTCVGDEVVGALHRAGAISVIKSTPRSPDGAILFLGSTPESFEAEIEKYKSSLLKRFQDLRYDKPS